MEIVQIDTKYDDLKLITSDGKIFNSGKKRIYYFDEIIKNCEELKGVEIKNKFINRGNDVSVIKKNDYLYAVKEIILPCMKYLKSGKTNCCTKDEYVITNYKSEYYALLNVSYEIKF